MTEIRIERKAAVWPWILGVLALALLAWLVFGAMGDDRGAEETVMERPAEGTGATAGGGGVPPAVQAYVSFAQGSTEVSADRAHAYTAEGLQRLTAALQAVVEQNASDADTRARFDRFREIAERVQNDPDSPKHANMVRDAFTSAADVFESAKVEAGDVSGLRQTASSIAADRPLLEQTEQVRQFFRQSADALQRASQRS